MKYSSDDIQSAELGLEVGVEPIAENSEELQGSVQTGTPLQMHFWARLQRIRDAEQEITSTARSIHEELVERGLFATYRECVDEGVALAVQHLLRI
jgi:hypothetical protein